MFKSHSSRPCADQSPEELEAYYRAVKVGDEVVVRETQYGILRYYVSTVDKLHRGRVYPKGHQSFFAKSGAMCREPHGQCDLVIPTPAVKAYAEANPADYKLSYSKYVVSVPPTIEEARQKLAEAESRLTRYQQAWDNYSGNNPNKYRSSIRDAQTDVSIWSAHVSRLEQAEANLLKDS